MNILVTAATGNVGSALVPLLTDRGVRVRTLAHDPAPDLSRAMADIDAVFLACGNVPEQVDFETAVIDAAARGGVRRIVKLSARGAELDSPVAFWHWHAVIEQHLAASGVPSTVLQPSFLMTNLLASAETVQQEGILVAPGGDAHISMVDPRDVAGAAAAALTEDGHEGRTHILTGPEAPTLDQVAAALTVATGRQVRYLDVPPEAATAAMVESGVPAFAAMQIVNVFAALRAGSQETTTSAVATLTGRPGSSMQQFVDRYAGAFGVTAPAAFTR